MTVEEHRQLAADYVEQAAETVSQKRRFGHAEIDFVGAGVKATLALYHQREADRLEQAEVPGLEGRQPREV